MKKITSLFAAVVVAMSTMAVTPVVTTEWQFGSTSPLIAAESFENCPTNGVPYTWTRFVENVTLGTVTNATAWVGTNTERKITGTFSAKMANYQSVSDCWLVTPKISITATSATSVSFNWSNTAGDYGSSLEVWVSESATQPTASTAFAATAFKTIGEGPDGAWHLVNLDLTAYIGKTIYLGFKVRNFGNPTNPDAGGDNWWIEDVKLPLQNMIGVGNLCRGLAYGKMGANERVFLVSREGGNLVHILNAATGAYLGTLPMGTAGIVIDSYFVINDAGMTSDGFLLVGSMALANGEFKVYRWDSETSAPTLAISYPAALGRMGDKITVAGSITTGTARVYAATASAVDGKTQIYYFDMVADDANPGKYKFVQTPKTLVAVPTNTSNPGIGLKPNGDFYFKGGGGQISSFTAAGVETSVSLPTVVSTGGNTVRYIGMDALNNEYISYFRTGKEKLNILKLPNGDLATASIVDSTATLGANANGNGTSGVVVNVLPNNNVELFVLSTNNGIGKYTVTGLFTTTGTNKNSSDKIRLIQTKNQLEVEGVTISSVELFNSVGQKVKTSYQNTINTSGLNGLYIVNIKESGKTVKTTKIRIN